MRMGWVEVVGIIWGTSLVILGWFYVTSIRAHHDDHGS
jgi:hypothetical protein